MIKGANGFGDAFKNILNSFKRGCSFVPGTLVLMADGTYKPIEELQVGDMVVATDPETGETGPRAVLAPLSSEGIKTLVHITIDTDADAGDQTGTLIATDNHPFWAPDLGAWIPASELSANSILSTAMGTQVSVVAVRKWTAHERVHNVTIDQLHTYYVLAGHTPVLVHNSNNPSCFTAPNTFFDRHGRMTNGTYTLDNAGMRPHLPRTVGEGKSVFLSHVDAERAVLNAAAYADTNGLWVGNKAKVYVTNGPVGVVGRTGELTNYINVYRTNSGFVHGAPGGAP